MRVTFTPNGNLLILADNEARAALAEANRRGGYPEAEGFMIQRLREDCEIEWVQPEWIGALTGSPIFADAVEYPDSGENYVPEGARVWWFPNYMIRDPWEELRRKGRVVFTLSEGGA